MNRNNTSPVAPQSPPKTDERPRYEAIKTCDGWHWQYRNAAGVIIARAPVSYPQFRVMAEAVDFDGRSNPDGGVFFRPADSTA